ncbi:hypothetical protein SNE25_11320 [Mucilaginibacter sabulilitoris]|uniref:Alpha/beta hydrolase n=1 Tax=Mucilaginibacter sabulilitoris TaxID=1173583 RepID=A0ABZ0TTL5_9SPHI|nr:hypothetical protein [Mucilaginibacter sabulilitoris]WPU96111.1 hypothetical protein SNE25_11320 [Mucilaginibacter sabulilitoris]
MKRYHLYVVLSISHIYLLFNTVAIAQNAVWQWSVPIKSAKYNDGKARAFLWIPPDCKKVKAFLFAQNNMEEQSILENENFRKEMGKLGFAEVWVSPAYDPLFHFDQGAGETFNNIMQELASVSGYSELAYIPFVGMGHSAAASSPYYMAAWNPERALAAISVSGQWPYFRHDSFAPDIWGNKNVDYIPCLETMGEYEAADSWSAEGLKERQDHPLMPLSMLACPAEFHFASTDSKAAYIALYLKKASQYRMPKRAPEGQAFKLIPIDPTKTGWLIDKWRFDQIPVEKPASVDQYQGDRTQAFWYFDKELANATIAYQARHRNQKPQLIGYVQQGKLLEQHNVHQQFNLKFEPEADGITFKVHTAFYDTVPDGSPRPAAWTHMPVGSCISHTKYNLPITVDRITGPFIKVNDSTFRVHPQKGFYESPHSYELWFSATHPGDDEYKPAVQQALMSIPPRNTQGKEQHITFSAIPNQQTNKKGIKLNAISDASVPVSFYVLDGPAKIVDEHVNLTAIPPRSKFPVKVTVVAWQYGNSNEPKLQTAEPVERVFWILKMLP